MKLKYGSAYTDNADIDNTLMLPIDPERSVDNRTFVEIVEARVKEIVETYGRRCQTNIPTSFWEVSSSQEEAPI